MPTQEGDGRGEFNSDAALKQPVQGAQAARVQSINPWVAKLTRKPTKVTTTKMVRNKEVKLTLYVFDGFYWQELVLSAMLEKVKPVLDTSYEPYVSDGNQEEDKEPELYQTDEGHLVLKKVAAFYNKVPMPCVVPNANKLIPTAKKPAQKRIPEIKHIILLKLMHESGNYKATWPLLEWIPSTPARPSTSSSTHVRIDNSPPLEPQAQEQESNPEPGFPQAARPVDRETARPPAFFWVEPLQADVEEDDPPRKVDQAKESTALSEVLITTPNEGDPATIGLMSLKSSPATNQEPTQGRGTGLQLGPMTSMLKQDNQVAKLGAATNERTPGPSAILLPLDPSPQFPGSALHNALMTPHKKC
ncbi:hypothetical protein DSO57_1031205 [Entomophthora muscae]|uniref:Uncharacterized protein n=1 Tax=Entomophthora muscae TaxID=34485 RepID=A0ACC2ULD2_9FUNG|nr:hypothetical protein DSO57_1031205 [Entomophthora muscae]